MSGVRRRTAARLATLAVGVWLSLGATGCKINQVPTPVCVHDDECGPGFACTAGGCIQHGVPQGTWAIEVVPRSDSSAATTRFPSRNFSDDVTVLVADAKKTVTAILPVGSALVPESHMVATVETAIPGYTDLTFEADSSASDGTYTFKVPAGALGQMTSFRMVPAPPNDSAQPPVVVKARLAETINLSYSSENYYITGKVVSMAQDARGPFTVRIFQGGQLVSDVTKVAMGSGIRAAVPVAVAFQNSGQPVTLELSVVIDDQGAVRRFSTRPFRVTANLDLGDLTFPSVPATATYRLRVIDPAQKPVGGAVVRAHADVSFDASGAVDFTRDGITDSNGYVDLTLVAGTSAAPRSYEVAVQPPAGSRFGSTCTSGFLITDSTPTSGSGSGSGGIATSLSVPEKVTLSGTLLSADGVSVAGATIVATRIGAGACGKAALVSPPATGTTDRNGSYQLMLDPGAYQFDYDPPAGAPVPRLTEGQVTVTAGANPERVVQMLPGALIKGAVQGPDGAALPLANVRFLEVTCVSSDACFGRNRVGPLLRGEAHTDADGTFRAVLPVQLSSP
jgi:hypothetical protein